MKTIGLPAIVDAVREALADFDRASLVVLAVQSQSCSRQFSVAARVHLVVARHPANEEVEQDVVFGRP